MTSHTCRPGHPGLLADDCERCDEHAAAPMLLDLDDQKTEALWDRMVAVKFGSSPAVSYQTANEAKAAHTLYLLGIWVERNLGVRPWRPLAELRASLALEDVYVVFDGAPSPPSPRFVEVETLERHGRSVGEWEEIEDDSGPRHWRLGPFKAPRSAS